MFVDPRADLRGEQLRLRAATSPKSRPWSLSQAARQTSARAASISVAMSATMNATPWNVPIGRPNCSRVCAYGIDGVERAPGRCPTASAPIEIRPPSRILRNVLKPLALLAEQVRRRDPRAVEEQLAGRRRVEAELVLEPADREAGRVGRDDERADLGGARRRVVPVRAVTMYVPGLAGVGDEPLAAVDDPACRRPGRPRGGRSSACRPSRSPAPGSVRPYAPMTLPGGHRDEEALLLLVRAGEVERPAAEARVGGDDEPERAPDPADLLDRDRVGQGVEAGPALVLGDRDAEPAELAEPADDLDAGSGAPARARR